jgi:hypothetical protein
LTKRPFFDTYITPPKKGGEGKAAYREVRTVIKGASAHVISFSYELELEIVVEVPSSSCSRVDDGPGMRGGSSSTESLTLNG